MLLHQETTQAIIDAFFKTYNVLGYGFSERIYGAALEIELTRAGLRVDREVLFLVPYEGAIVGRVRVDRVVDSKVIVELKASAKMEASAEAQVFNYLRATNLEVGLLLHYGPRPVFKRYIFTNDRKDGIDLRQGSIAAFVPGQDRDRG